MCGAALAFTATLPSKPACAGREQATVRLICSMAAETLSYGEHVVRSSGADCARYMAGFNSDGTDIAPKAPSSRLDAIVPRSLPRDQLGLARDHPEAAQNVHHVLRELVEPRRPGRVGLAIGALALRLALGSFGRLLARSLASARSAAVTSRGNSDPAGLGEEWNVRQQERHHGRCPAWSAELAFLREAGSLCET